MQALIYGYGNPGRQDDGLGIALTQRLEAWVSENQLMGVEFDNNYQLNIEDADAIAQKDIVIFADASDEDIEDFCFSRVDASAKVSFTTHAASPGYIVQLCKELFQKEPLALLLHIKGYEWAFQEGLSERARENLEGALAQMKTLLTDLENITRLQEDLKKC
ncbi:MAG: Ni/Fe hydrogenase [Chloroflexi bacterium]|nr:MAG: Ni/Fe hydrogenase [Chloroflexota bacterium]MBL1195715.1 hydrogenase maturation protease [Chloroflexota bacterium]NOH13003.1 hydrogenase maturation protease [Chloroflexota bacterium]